MEIFSKKRPEDKKPKFVFNPDEHDLSKMTMKEREVYWNEEEYRWENGHAGLIGDYYFHLTQMLVKTPRGTRIPPRWMDIDEMTFDWQAQVRKEQKDGVVFKKRRAHYSTIFGQTIPIKLCLENAGGIFAMTSCDKPRTIDLFKQKLMTGFRGLSKYRNVSNLKAADWKELEKKKLIPPWVQWREGKGTRMDSGRLAIEFLKEGESTGDVSEVICEQTSDAPGDAAKFEGLGLIGALIDEYFLHPRPEDVRVSISAGMTEDGGSKFASAFLGGSAGLMSTEGIKNAREMIEEANRGYKGFGFWFISGAQGVMGADEYDDNGSKTGRKHNFCINGYSDVEKATEYIMRTREILERKKNKKEYWQFMYAYPLSVDELFQMVSDSWLTRDIMDLLMQQKNNITNNSAHLGKIVKQYDLEDSGEKILAKVV